MNAAWDKLGGATGPLGPPVADQTEDGDVVTQRFTGGEISWDKKTNKFSTEPANLASGLTGLTVPGYEPPDASNAAASDSKDRNWFTPSWWWLLAGIPVLVLVGLILVATLRNRGGGGDDDVDTLDDPSSTSTPRMTPRPRRRRCGLRAPMSLQGCRLTESYARPSDSALYGLGGAGQRSRTRTRATTATSSPSSEPEPDDSDTAPTPHPTRIGRGLRQALGGSARRTTGRSCSEPVDGARCGTRR